MEPVSGFKTKMSVRRCRFLLMLLLFSFISVYCLVKWSAQIKRRNLPSSQILHEVEAHQVDSVHKEDIDADDRGMYDEIELTEEDLHIAAEKRASLTKFMGFKKPKDRFGPKIASDKLKYQSRAPNVKNFKASSTPRTDVTNSPSGNNVDQNQIAVPTIATTSSGNIEIQNGNVVTGTNDTVLNVKEQQKFGAEILAEPSEVHPPLDSTNPRKAVSKHQHLLNVKSPQDARVKPIISQPRGDEARKPFPAKIPKQQKTDVKQNDVNQKENIRHSAPSKVTQQQETAVGSNATNQHENVKDPSPLNATNTHEEGKNPSPPNASRPHKATVRQPHLSPRVIQQLQHIQSVGQQLFDLQTYMQDDRIYYQFHKNKSRLGNLAEEDQRIEQEREDKILKTNSDLKNLQFPESPAEHDHGYPIQFQEANYIPSGQEHQRPKSNKAKIKDQGNDGRQNNQQNAPENQMQHPDNALLMGDLNAQSNPQQNGYSDNVNEMLKMMYGDVGGNQDTSKKSVSQVNKVPTNTRFQGSFRDKVNAMLKKREDDALHDNAPNGLFANRFSNKYPQYPEYPVNKVPRGDDVQHAEKSLDIDQNGSATAVPTKVQTTPLKYEQLPHGDLTVHHAPTNKEQNVNSIEDKVKDLGSDKDEGNPDEALTLSKVFIQSMTNTTSLNDTVATVQQKTLFQKPTEIHRMNGLWQVHKSPQAMYLYSAYYDDRPALDRHKVRIIGIANAAVKNPHCLLWYKNQTTPDIAMTVLTKIGPRIQPLSSSANRYEPYIFTCAVIRGKGAPEQVSMITIKETKPTTLLSVNIPVKPPKDQQIEIGQCMSVVYWNQDPTRLIEWLEANRLWGIGEVTVYADELDDAATSVFTDYADKGFVDFRQMPNILDDDSEFTILLNMSPAINDCMYRNMYRYKKVLCTDVDEMVVPRRAANYTEMMEQILAAKGSGHPHPSFMFRNVYFFTDFGPHVEEPWFLHSQRYLKHVKPSEFGYSVKSITDPQACIALQNHLCWKRIRKYDRKNWTIDVPISLGRNQHYKKCHFDSYLGQLGACDRMMKEYFVDYNIERFGPALYDRVAEKLLQFKIADAVVSASP